MVVRAHPARTSNAQFIQDMVNAVEEVNGEPMQLHMLTFDTELDNTLSLQKGGSYIDKQALQLKAFHNEEDGQAYSNVDSRNGTAIEKAIIIILSILVLVFLQKHSCSCNN